MLPPICHFIEILHGIFHTAFLEARVDKVSIGVHIWKDRLGLHLFKELLCLSKHPVLTELTNDVVEATNIHLGILPGLAVKYLDCLLELALLKALVDHDTVGFGVDANEAWWCVVVDHGLPQVVGLLVLAMLEECLEQDIAGGRRHLEAPCEQGLEVVHGLLVLALLPVALHEGGVDDAIVDSAPLGELVEELEGPAPVVEVDVASDEVVVDERVSTSAFEHLTKEVPGVADAAGSDEALGEVAVGDGGGGKGRGREHVAVHLHRVVHAGGLDVGEDEGVVGDDVGDDVGAAEEELEEGDGVGVAPGADHGRGDGVAGEDGGPDAGGDGGAGGNGGAVEIPRADEGLDAVVEAEARADERGGGVGEAGRVGVPRGRRPATEGVQRRLDAEAALPPAALRGGLFSGGEGEVAAARGGEEPRKGGRW